MKKLKKACQFYESLKIPKQLEYTVESAFKENKKTKRKWVFTKTILAITCSVCFAFFIMVNTNMSFANAVSNIPIVRDIAEIFTIRDYKEDNESELIDAKVPALRNTGNTALEKRINAEIMHKVDALVHDVKNRAKEYQNILKEANYTDAAIKRIEVQIDYEIKSNTKERVSFVLSKSEYFGSNYTEKYYYNVDLTTGKDITLKDMLGENYKSIANSQIKEQIQERIENDENAMFFSEEDDPYLEDGSSFKSISDKQEFYINEEGNVVIVFPKYTIAPGYMGILEFEIKK